jgi:hypothetical protein
MITAAEARQLQCKNLKTQLNEDACFVLSLLQDKIISMIREGDKYHGSTTVGFDCVFDEHQIYTMTNYLEYLGYSKIIIRQYDKKGNRLGVHWD